MAYSEPAPTPTRRVRIRRVRVAGLLVVTAVIVVALGEQVTRSPSSTVSSSSSASSTSIPRSPVVGRRGDRRDALGEADGSVPAGTTIFDDDVPGVAKLDPALLGALRRAAADAARDRVTFVVNSGWRSPAYEEHLLREAIVKYGSQAAAARWVATPHTSAHVSGHAVDIGPVAATAWLSAHGAAYGLCQIYGNEPWHYELRSAAIDHGCPPMYADPTHDPRMQQ